MLSRKDCLRLLLSSWLAGPLAAAAAPLYTLTFLPPDFVAADINNAGQIVGTAGGGAALWSPASLTSLGALLPGSEGLGLNNHGDIVGRHGNHGFVYANGVASAIAADERSWATGINDAGQVSGTAASYAIGGPQRAFLYSAGIVTLADSADHLPGDTVGNAINSSGVIAGAFAYGGHWSNPERSPFTFGDGRLLTYGSLGGDIAEALDINDAGALAGWSTDYEGARELAFRLDAQRGMLDLGSLGGASSRALGLNNLGWVVGMSDTGAAQGYDYHAFLHRGDGMLDLNLLAAPVDGWRLVYAQDVNDAGQILAQACQTGSGDCRAVRLDLTSPVPAPPAWALLLAGLPLLVARLRRRLKPWPLWVLPLAGAPMAAAAQSPHAFTLTRAPAGFEARALNHNGQIVGTARGAAAVWDGAGIRTITRLAPGSWGHGINQRGDLVGVWHSHAFIHSAAGVRDLGRFGSWASSDAVAVNDRGAVAGNGYWGIGEEWRGWVFSHGILRMIGSFGGDWSSASAINNAGQVVGSAALVPFRSPYGDYRAFLYRDRMLQDLGALGDGVSSWATDINDAGQVVGGSEFAFDPEGMSQYHPFLYHERLMRDLGTLGGTQAQANGINNHGAVVGESLLADGAARHAFLYEHGVLRDLHAITRMPRGWVLVSALDINDRRQILARACREQECAMVRLDPLARRP